MSREMKKGMVDLMLLVEIARGGVSGVDLVSSLEGLFPSGTIYPALARLERGGLLSARRRRAVTGRIRKEYDLSPAGRDELENLTATWDALKSAVEGRRKEAARGT